MARQYIGAVFHKALKDKVKPPKPKPKAKSGGNARPVRQVGEDDDEAFQEKQRNYRLTTINATNSWGLKILVSISYLAKLPLTEFYHWHMKHVKIHNREVDKAKKLGDTYFGPTPMSKITRYKGEEVSAQLSKSLQRSAWEDTELLGEIMQEMPDDLKESATNLYVLLVAQGLSNWKQRVLNLINSFPMLIN